MLMQDSRPLTRRVFLLALAAVGPIGLAGCTSRRDDDPRTIAEQYVKALYEGDRAMAVSLLDGGNVQQKKSLELNLPAMCEQFALFAAERKGLRSVGAQRIWEFPGDFPTEPVHGAIFVEAVFHSGYDCVIRVDLIKRKGDVWRVDPGRHAFRGAVKEGINLNF